MIFQTNSQHNKKAMHLCGGTGALPPASVWLRRGFAMQFATELRKAFLQYFIWIKVFYKWPPHIKEVLYSVKKGRSDNPAS